CTSDLVITSPFVLSSDDEVPSIILIDNFGIPGTRAHQNAPNQPWLMSACLRSGFIPVHRKTWEYDTASIHAKRMSPKFYEHSTPFERLPDDSGLENRTAILVASCERYCQAWRPFFTLFQRYWPDCPYQVFLGTDRGSYPGVSMIETRTPPGPKNWS